MLSGPRNAGLSHTQPRTGHLGFRVVPLARLSLCPEPRYHQYTHKRCGRYSHPRASENERGSAACRGRTIASHRIDQQPCTPGLALETGRLCSASSEPHLVSHHVTPKRRPAATATAPPANTARHGISTSQHEHWQTNAPFCIRSGFELVNTVLAVYPTPSHHGVATQPTRLHPQQFCRWYDQRQPRWSCKMYVFAELCQCGLMMNGGQVTRSTIVGP